MDLDRASILLVDDEPPVIHVLGTKLRGSGYAVHTARDGRAGLQAALEHQPELIITDQSMPRLDGLAMLDELCGVLEYLHTRTPAVLHRDIKPDNIICHAQTGELCLIDFGSARDHMTRHATTVVGTFGFMAPEQLVAQATPASDLYALGILGVVLLTKMDVLELINEDHVMDWGPHVRASAPTVALLEDLTRRSARERLSEACVVRARIHEILHPTRAPSGALIKAPSESLPDAVPKTESLFGVICLMLAVPLMAAPCMVALVGFEYTAVGVSIALLGVILMTPFLPSAPAPSHKALPPPEPAAKRER